MRHPKTSLDGKDLPENIRALVEGADLYDYTFSNRAKTVYIDKADGFFLKIAPSGVLETAAKMHRFLSGHGLTSRFYAYERRENDYFLAGRVMGEAACAKTHTADPRLLCAVLGESLRRLHETNPAGCPVIGATGALLARAIPAGAERPGYVNGSLLEYLGVSDPDDAWRFLLSHPGILREDAVLHGDPCLPNILLADFRFSGFIDFEGGGLGDRHHDLFWTVWSLQYNLKTPDWGDYFLDAYGRDQFDAERYRFCGILQAFAD